MFNREKILKLALQNQKNLGRDTKNKLHGVPHWLQVEAIAKALWTHSQPKAGQVNEILIGFALLHDACRNTDRSDPNHGPRSASWIESDKLLQNHLGGRDQAELVAQACRIHTNGPPQKHPILGICLDADRLTLGRCGIRPQVEYISHPTTLEFLEKPFLLAEEKPGLAKVYWWGNLLPGKEPSPQTEENLFLTELDKPQGTYQNAFPFPLLAAFERLAKVDSPLENQETQIKQKFEIGYDAVLLSYARKLALKHTVHTCPMP